MYCFTFCNRAKQLILLNVGVAGGVVGAILLILLLIVVLLIVVCVVR